MRPEAEGAHPSGRGRVHGDRQVPVRLGYLVASLHAIPGPHDGTRRLAGMLAEGNDDLVRIPHAPDGHLCGQGLELRRMHPVAEVADLHLKRSARFSHFSRSFSLGLSGVPGWMICAGHFSAALTRSLNVPALGSLMYACFLSL